jgi:hypothetical protein
MYRRILCMAVLLVSISALLSLQKPANATPSNPVAPIVVASGKLENQTAPIQQTLFTPSQNGMYRVSVYATTVQKDSSSRSSWILNAYWTDDAGIEVASHLLFAGSNVRGQWTYKSQISQTGGPVLTFEANAGTPISLSVRHAGPSDSSVWSLYYAVEFVE